MMHVGWASDGPMQSDLNHYKLTPSSLLGTVTYTATTSLLMLLGEAIVLQALLMCAQFIGQRLGTLARYCIQGEKQRSV
jgi:hypothetical protein